MRIYGDFLALGLHALRRFSRSPLPQVLTLARATAQVPDCAPVAQVYFLR